MVFPNQQRMIANWAVLKAMVAEFDPQSTVTTHYMQRRYFKDNLKPPAGWTVWIGPYLRGNWVTHWGSTPFQYFSRKQEMRAGPDVRATHHNSHISTQVVGKLFIQVIRCPYRGFVERWRFATPDKGSLFRIWPPSETIINWPGQFMSDRDADYVAGAMFNFLMAGTAPLLERAISALYIRADSCPAIRISPRARVTVTVHLTLARTCWTRRKTLNDRCAQNRIC